MKLDFKALIVLLIPFTLATYSVNGYADTVLNMVPGSRLVERVTLGAPYYVLPVSSIRKVNGVIAAEHNLYLTGELSAYTWQVVPGMGPERAHLTSLSQLQDAGAEVLFDCHGRACGSSNQWANQVFHESGLYGLDEQQRYTALKQQVPQGVDYYALYTTQRGNRKVYLHFEHLQGMTQQIGQ
ncbi:MAG: DUF4892 domain-containing protein [Oceanospirillaceae bacterium]|jgi:hypothetical protein|nr:DUF4892 domain-containing protein [Oceanospirillaceae bacterium]MBT4443387.1 DUF4892 domain-containing protein [Oceanospirillaceae bacterium]MBT6078622.1 DUF4892 domain-containing protein [Oceanospirillaceae bacterium]MBT7330456.1 DUF4892 domain-containing protein [Oceanospirillaceae bacterium]